MQDDYFYIENGFYVFTEKYHLKRGYCCKSGCRHCPWNFKKNNDSSSPNTKIPTKNKDENEN